MSDVLEAAGIIGSVLGVVMAGIALIGMIASVRDPFPRMRALGFVYGGMSVVAASGALLVIARLGDRLPTIAGLPAIALLALVALLLRLAASREFQRARSEKSD
jgi:hypothetical protein